MGKAAEPDHHCERKNKSGSPIERESSEIPAGISGGLECPIDNSATERDIRPFTVGRANWHVIDTTHGAQASASVYSLVETAKANNLKIYAYLNCLLSEIPKHMEDKSPNFIDSLLPWSPTLPQECKL